MIHSEFFRFDTVSHMLLTGVGYDSCAPPVQKPSASAKGRRVSASRVRYWWRLLVAALHHTKKEVAQKRFSYLAGAWFKCLQGYRIRISGRASSRSHVHLLETTRAGLITSRRALPPPSRQSFFFWISFDVEADGCD